VSTKPPSRILTATDYDRLIALWQAAGLHFKPQGRDTRAAFERQLAGGTQIAIGIDGSDGTLIGAVLATHDGRKGWINRLAVHPDHRRQGIATRLVDAAEEVLRERGLHIFAALIEPGNDASLALFEEAGYTDWPGMHYVSKRDSEDV
jgi:ribosomal protein S18 acetylase RimI-like enzyme